MTTDTEILPGVPTRKALLDSLLSKGTLAAAAEIIADSQDLVARRCQARIDCIIAAATATAADRMVPHLTQPPIEYVLAALATHIIGSGGRHGNGLMGGDARGAARAGHFARTGPRGGAWDAAADQAAAILTAAPRFGGSDWVIACTESCASSGGSDRCEVSAAFFDAANPVLAAWATVALAPWGDPIRRIIPCPAGLGWRGLGYIQDWLRTRLGSSSTREMYGENIALPASEG